MNPLADFVDIPASQFVIVYGALAFFAGIFLLYVRWEAAHGEGPRPEDPAAHARKMLVKVRVAIGLVVAAFVAIGGVKIAMNAQREKPVGGIVAAVVAVVVGGVALAVPALKVEAREDGARGNGA